MGELNPIAIDTDSRIAQQPGLFLHCVKCFRDPDRSGRSMEKYARYSVIRSAHGLQVWCDRHRCNVAMITLDWGSDAPTCAGCEICHG